MVPVSSSHTVSCNIHEKMGTWHGTEQNVYIISFRNILSHVVECPILTMVIPKSYGNLIGCGNLEVLHTSRWCFSIKQEIFKEEMSCLKEKSFFLQYLHHKILMVPICLQVTKCHGTDIAAGLTVQTSISMLLSLYFMFFSEILSCKFLTHWHMASVAIIWKKCNFQTFLQIDIWAIPRNLFVSLVSVNGLVLSDYKPLSETMLNQGWGAVSYSNLSITQAKIYSSAYWLRCWLLLHDFMLIWQETRYLL